MTVSFFPVTIAITDHLRLHHNGIFLRTLLCVLWLNLQLLHKFKYISDLEKWIKCSTRHGIFQFEVQPTFMLLINSFQIMLKLTWCRWSKDNIYVIMILLDQSVCQISSNGRRFIDNMCFWSLMLMKCKDYLLILSVFPSPYQNPWDSILLTAPKPNDDITNSSSLEIGKNCGNYSQAKKSQKNQDITAKMKRC